MKKFLRLCLLLMMLFTLVMPMKITWAAALPQDEAAIYYNGEQQECKVWLRDGTAFLPLRAVAGLLQIRVSYFDDENVVQLLDGTNIYQFYLNDSTVRVNGSERRPLDVPPVMRDDSVWLPLRSLAELLHMQIELNEADYRVEISEPLLTVENGVVIKTLHNAVDVQLPAGIREIGAQAFYAKHLETIDLQNSADTLQKIGFAAFYSNKIKQINIPDGVSEIDGSAFSSCWDLAEVKLPAELKAIRAETFIETNLRRLIVPPKVTEIEYNIFNLHPQNKTPHYTPIELVVLPPSVQIIDDRAFELCPDLVLEGLAGSYAEEYAKAHELVFRVITEQDLAAYYQPTTADGTWLADRERDEIVQMLKDIPLRQAQLDASGVAAVNPAKLQVARPIFAYYYNGVGFEPLHIIYPLLYEGDLRYLLSARAMTESADKYFYSFNENRFVAELKKAMAGGVAVALVYDANCTYIFDGDNWRLVREIHDVHLRDPEGPALNPAEQIDVSDLRLMTLADPVSIEDAYLGCLPKVAPTAD